MTPSEVTSNLDKTAGAADPAGEAVLRAARAKFDAHLYDQALSDLRPNAQGLHALNLSARTPSPFHTFEYLDALLGTCQELRRPPPTLRS